MGMQNVEDFYPLSPMQQGLLFHTLSAPDTGVYFNQLVCTLSGQLNIPVFERVWQQVIQRHSILRTCFRWQGLKEPIQVVLRQVQLPLKHYNWQGLSSTEQQQKLAAFLESDLTLGLNLTQAPLMRLALIQLSENTYQFVWNTHHLITDGWSTSLLLEEVLKFYTAFCQGEELRLEPPRPYRDYIKWLQQQDLPKAETFWRQTLSGFSAPTNLRIEKTFSSTYSKNHAAQEIKLSASQTVAMRSLVRQQQITLNTLVQGAWAWLLSYYSGETDVIFGVTVSGRPVMLAGAESMVGLFINTLPLRMQVSSDTSVLALLKQIQTQQAEISQYEYSPLVQVQGWSEVPRGMSLFDSILVFENYPVDTTKRQISNLHISNVLTDERTSYPLTVTVVPSQELSLEIAYHRERFDDDAITRMLGHLCNLLVGMVANHEKRLSDLSLLTEAEKQTLLLEWNNTQTEYPQDLCIHQLFEAQVEKTPDAVAVVFDEQSLTYQELNERANQLAHYLQKLGVEPEVLVGICVERSLEMVIGLLAILKAGGAYVPLDPRLPQERLAFMVEDAQVSLLLTQTQLLQSLKLLPTQLINLDKDWEEITQLPHSNHIQIQLHPDNLAYIIYTSGSTGQSKGVMIQHRSLVNAYFAWETIYQLSTTATSHLQMANFSFDVFSGDLIRALCSGGKLVLCPRDFLLSPEQLYKLMQQEKVDCAEFVPAVLRNLIQYLEISQQRLDFMRLLICGSDSWSGAEYQKFFQYCSLQTRLINSYGLTEATIDSSYFETTAKDVTLDQLVPIGKAFPNNKLYVLDKNLHPLPIGIPGELYISGVSLARGYTHRPDLTAQKFIPNPFSNQPGEHLYKTGDIVRYLSDGNIEFLKRIDHQVKIRGFRIELGEIEAKLVQHSCVQESVVVVREDNPGDKRLVAYIVSNTHNSELENNRELTPHLRQFLKESLPDYMVPAAFVILAKLPLTPNGKIDRKALPLPDYDWSNNETKYIAARTPIEEQLANIWTDLLKVKQVGIEDNFFDLGGHSLLLTQLVFRVHQTWQIELPLSSLWEMPTVASLAQSIEKTQKMGYSTLAITYSNKINWQAEAVLDSAIRPETPVKYSTEPANIFLTGATGFVGAFLLYELLQQTHADIYCLVRAANPEDGKKRIQSSLESYLLWDNSFSSRIIAVVGNLSEPVLGLSQQKFQELAELIDVIYHNGALVHHASPYATLKAANVLGTQEVLRLATQFKVKPVHFMSTDGVFCAKGYSGVKVVTEQDSLDDYQVPSGGYTQSKWVAEKLVTIARDRGLPVCIYRLGRVSGHSKTGVFNQNDFLYRLIIGCIKLEKVPNGNMIEDIAPVDYVSKAIVYLSQQEKSIGQAFHFVNPQPFHSNRLIKLLHSLGYPLQEISDELWQVDLLKIAEHYPEHPLYPLVPLLINKDSENNHKSSAILKFDCQNTHDALANSSIFCPPIDDNLLSVYLKYLMQQGLLKAPKHEFINI
jgi:myxalamid-type nonribosomal peptide synthetase MxaA